MYLSPLRLIGVPVAEIRLTLLLSLRFLAVVFEEIRNLALGLAARNVDWRGMGKGAGIQVRQERAFFYLSACRWPPSEHAAFC